MKNNIGKYDDIINLPHHTSIKHPRMTVLNRAAQFAPFAALTGYNDAINEKARTTESRILLTDEEKEMINHKIINAASMVNTVVTVTYFEPDNKKDGGSYISVTGCIKKIDDIEKEIVMKDNFIIPLESIVDIN